MELEADVWMEDLDLIADDISNASITGNVVITLGISNKVELRAIVKWMSDGTHPDLIQDKQRQTLRFRVYNLAVVAVQGA